MQIKYSRHIENRLRLRKIHRDLPKIIYEESDERYFDKATGYNIAVMRVELYGKAREGMLAYIIEGKNAKLLTLHPLKEGQKEKRIKAGRWRKLQ